MKRIRVLISGRVQGVFFRAECQEMALGRGLGGSVRNLSDGRVEAVFEGADADVEAALSWCRVGPALARVTGLEVTEETPSGATRFEAV